MFRNAFTLAEVLITLSIIGIIGALTIPSLVKDYQQHMYRQKWKKVYSIFAQATKVLESSGNTECIRNCDADGNNCVPSPGSCLTNDQYTGIRDAFSSVLKYSKIGVDVRTILANQYYNYKNSNPAMDFQYGNVGTLVLTDGTSVYFSSGGMILVDLNGQKGPNQAGIDFFALTVKNNANKIVVEPARYDSGYSCKLGLTGWYGSFNCFGKALSNDPMP